MKIRRTEFGTMREAVAHAAANDMAAVMLEGKPATITKDDARRLESNRVYFAYLCQHKGEVFTVPVNESRAEPKAIDEADLFEALKDNMSPEALAAIASYIDTANSTVGTNNPAVDDQVAWFAGQLRELVGGEKQYNSLCEGLGL